MAIELGKSMLEEVACKVLSLVRAPGLEIGLGAFNLVQKILEPTYIRFHMP